MWLLLGFSIAARGQVHQVGSNALDLYGNRTGIGTLFGLSYNHNTSEVFFLKIRSGFELGRLYSFPYQNVTIDLMAFYAPVPLGNYVQVNLGAGPTAGWEHVGGIEKSRAKDVGFHAGIKGGLEVETFLGDQLSFFLHGDQTLEVKKSLGQQSFQVGIGIRLFLNNYY